MYSTLSAVCSISADKDMVPRILPATHERPSYNCSHNIPVSIEGSGASWEGKTETMTRSSLRMVIEGCPLVVLSQSLQLQLQSQWSEIEMEGIVQGITPMGNASEGRWSRVQLDISYNCLDDLRWQQLKLILRNLSSPDSSSFLRGTLVPLDSGDSLWKMKSEQIPSDLVSCHDSTIERAARVIEQVSQSAKLCLVEANRSDAEGSDRVPETRGESLEVPIISTSLEFPNSHGRLIRAYYDAPRTTLPAGSPVVILSPGYGETKREYITLAYYFASNGFHVLRYDHTNHVGDSDGEHTHTTLSMMRDDLGSVLKYVDGQWPTSSRGVVATSLSGRVAMKTVAHDVSVDFLFLITPIVDVRKTLQAVHQEDLIASYEHGQQKGVTNVLGFNVELDYWLADAVTGDYSDLDATYHDISCIQAPVVIVSAEHDAWVEVGATKTLVEAFGDRLQQWVVIPRGLHRVLESPKQAKAVYRELLHVARRKLLPGQQKSRIQEPTRKTIGRQNKIERVQKKTGVLHLELSGFWKDYLDQFHYIVNFSDYQQLLDHMLRLMGPVKSGEKILDAGCGNGNFGSFLLKHEQAKTNQKGARGCEKFQYVGIDFVPTALQHARKNYQASSMTMTSSDTHENIQDIDVASAFHCVDLNKPLPFKDGTFGKVVSNLVLGYLDSPGKTIQELMRVLAPGGSLVFTNLKPNSDLSRIFTNFVQETSKTEEIEEAKQLLNNSGKIREAEGEGLFRFPDAEELEELIRSASKGGQTKIFSTFANQAYIVAVTKGLVQVEPAFNSSLEVLQAA